VILPAGAAIDYIAGSVPTPPRWMGKAGLEWAFRLYSEPKRLWQRYLIEPWSILWLVALDFFHKFLGKSQSARSTE
jgi:N-acetylglucosaminyldiphosphoundecaprenol N-acetyl-beta-D-mannosaminyltransferase